MKNILVCKKKKTRKLEGNSFTWSGKGRQKKKRPGHEIRGMHMEHKKNKNRKKRLMIE